MNATLNGSTSTTPANVQALDLDTPPAPRGFPDLPCMYCGESGCLTLDLSDMTGDEALTCGQCETSYSLADVRHKITAWLPVLRWIDLAPQLASE